MEPWLVEQYGEIAEARLRIIEHEGGRQAFFHFMEMETHRYFVQLNDRLTFVQQCERQALVDRVCDCLVRRVDARLAGATELERPCAQDVIAITRIFELAAAHLDAPSDAGDALLAFARGDLGRVVYFTHESEKHAYRISEPDSGYIFLFAELGLVGHDLGLPFWTSRLLVDLIRMQRYFLARNAHQRPRPWRQYRQPRKPLSNASRSRIDADYAPLTASPPSIDVLANLMRDHLRFAVGEIGPKQDPGDATLFATFAT